MQGCWMSLAMTPILKRARRKWTTSRAALLAREAKGRARLNINRCPRIGGAATFGVEPNNEALPGRELNPRHADFQSAPLYGAPCSSRKRAGHQVMNRIPSRNVCTRTKQSELEPAILQFSRIRPCCFGDDGAVACRSLRTQLWTFDLGTMTATLGSSVLSYKITGTVEATTNLLRSPADSARLPDYRPAFFMISSSLVILTLCLPGTYSRKNSFIRSRFQI